MVAGREQPCLEVGAAAASSVRLLFAGELRHWKLPSSGPATILITFITINVHGYAFFITSRYHVLAFHELLN